MSKILVKTWYGSLNLVSIILLPFSLLFFFTITVRKFFYKIGIFKKNKFKTPIIIVGNLTVGGTGKTPLTIWLYNYFFERGLKAGIISSGYKSSNKNPSIIKDNSSAKIFGDEAVLIYEKTKGCVISGKDRVLATHMMEREFNCDLIIHDDGLQNYAVCRDLEILIVDGKRKFGNGLLLPAGPMRETKKRLYNTDIIVMNNSSDLDAPAIQSVNNKVLNSSTSEIINLTEFSGKEIHFVSGIANTMTIELALTNNNILYKTHIYPDHHEYRGEEIIFQDDLPVFITEKDYVKLKKNKNKDLWVMQLEIKPNKEFISKLDKWVDIGVRNEN